MTGISRGVARLNEWALIQGEWKHKLALHKVKWFKFPSTTDFYFLIKNFVIYEFNASVFPSEFIPLQFISLC
jgi:hypothetical protein